VKDGKGSEDSCSDGRSDNWGIVIYSGRGERERVACDFYFVYIPIYLLIIYGF
jgi:hypothetical protein